MYRINRKQLITLTLATCPWRFLPINVADLAAREGCRVNDRDLPDSGCSAKCVGILFFIDCDRCLELTVLGGRGGGDSGEIIL